MLGRQRTQDNNFKKNNMKKIKFILSAAFVSLLFFGCDAEKASQDVEDVIGYDSYPTPSFTLTGGDKTFNESGEPMFVYNIVLDKPTDRNLNYSFEQTGGTAELHSDYDVVNATIQAYETTGQMMVIIHTDTEVEGTEDLQLQVIPGPSLANKYINNPSTTYPSLDLTIEDYVFCFWILETSDTYGDGWNGGYVEVVSEGVTTKYAADDDVADLFEIAITDGADYSFTYVSGGGTGGAPGWESENYFKLTAPDGTVWEEGTMDYSGIPTPGLITSGTNNCP